MKDRQEKINILFERYEDFKEYCILENIQYNYLKDENYTHEKISKEVVNDRIKYFKSNYNVRVLENLRKSFLKRRNKLYERMLVLLNHSRNNYFLTLTFNNQSINVREKTLFDRVTRYLRCNFKWYISNVDFGETTGRIHFHVVISLDNYYDTYKFDKWKWGFISFKKIKTSDDYKALSNYMNKLVSHTLKNSTKNYNINYCERLRVLR